MAQEPCGPVDAETKERKGQVSAYRYIKAADQPEVFCVAHGRKRHVPHSAWFWEEAGDGAPQIETVSDNDVDSLPLGPACPSPSHLGQMPFDRILHDPDMMRLYLGSLLAGNGIECGAGNRPLPVSLGAAVQYLEAFRYGSEEARSFPDAKRFDNFMPIDIVDRIDEMRTVADGSQDFIIASHVIEHTANPVRAMANFYRVCRPGGLAILIVPDRDRMFDRVRPVTTAAHMLADYDAPDTARDLEHYVEYFEKVLGKSREEARADWERGGDMHYHTFTPASFVQLVGEMGVRQITRWREVRCLAPDDRNGDRQGEFYVVLGR